MNMYKIAAAAVCIAILALTVKNVRAEISTEDISPMAPPNLPVIRSTQEISGRLPAPSEATGEDATAASAISAFDAKIPKR